MRLRSGTLMIAIGIVHSTLTLLGGRGDLAGIVRHGVINTVAIKGGPYAGVFWALTAGLAWILLGAAFRRMEQLTAQPLPAGIGAGVICVALTGVIVAPAGGFWALLALGCLILWRARTPASTTTGTSALR